MVSLNVGVRPAHPIDIQKRQLHFGHDPLFERNDRFESLADNQNEQQALEALLTQASLKQASNLTGKEVAQASQFLYDIRGGIRGKKALALALSAAALEYKLTKDDPVATTTERSLAGIKYANAKIAADKGVHEAFQLLDSSIKALKQIGVPKPGDEGFSTYLRGLYNRGMYFVNNPIYKDTAKNSGPIEMQLAAATHEGLQFVPTEGDIPTRYGVKAVKEGLPYLKEAIMLAEGVDDDKIALTEALSAKGEALHILSHLNWYDGHESNDRDALKAFKKAFETVASVPPEKQTPRHYKLLERLGKVKIPHMCSFRHRPDGLSAQCIDTQMRARYALEDMQNQKPPMNRAEEIAENFKPSMGLPGLFQVFIIGD